jgi:hypothetical protein
LHARIAIDKTLEKTWILRQSNFACHLSLDFHESYSLESKISAKLPSRLRFQAITAPSRAMPQLTADSGLVFLILHINRLWRKSVAIRKMCLTNPRPGVRLENPCQTPTQDISVKKLGDSTG